MSDVCKLREANGLTDCPCDGAACVFWRVVELARGESFEGCAIEYYELIGDTGVAEWLLSVKSRVEGAAPA